jgi:hypothetical protein
MWPGNAQAGEVGVSLSPSPVRGSVGPPLRAYQWILGNWSDAGVAGGRPVQEMACVDPRIRVRTSETEYSGISLL